MKRVVLVGLLILALVVITKANPLGTKAGKLGAFPDAKDNSH